MSMQEPKPMTRRSLLGKLSLLALSTSSLSALATRAHAKTATWANGFELAVNFEINEPGGERYQRPFVAVWIEDKDTLAVRTLSLWVQTVRRGPRYIPDLKRWYRDERERRVLNSGDLVKTISGATRPPGKYRVVWNGRDDNGKLVEQGNYTLCIEAAREHGTYQIIKTALPIGVKPFRKSLGGNIEIKGATVEFRRK